MYVIKIKKSRDSAVIKHAEKISVTRPNHATQSDGRKRFKKPSVGIKNSSDQNLATQLSIKLKNIRINRRS
jgi:hypothetical protein